MGICTLHYKSIFIQAGSWQAVRDLIGFLHVTLNYRNEYFSDRKREIPWSFRRPMEALKHLFFCKNKIVDIIGLSRRSSYYHSTDYLISTTTCSTFLTPNRWSDIVEQSSGSQCASLNFLFTHRRWAKYYAIMHLSRSSSLHNHVRSPEYLAFYHY